MRNIAGYAAAVEYLQNFHGLATVTHRTLRREARLERIRHIRRGNCVEFSPSALDKWAERLVKGRK